MARRKSGTPIQVRDIGSKGILSDGQVVEASDQQAQTAKDRVVQLESELASSKRALHDIHCELEDSKEEYQAANEELLSIAEELRSANEELQASREELQFLNHELYSINDQLKSKVAELETNQEDLKNLIVATDVATLCLDCDLHIRWFTPSVTRLIRLQPSDKDRPISDITNDFSVCDLADASRRVLDDLTPIASEVHADKDRTFLRRISPCSMTGNRIGGVVITFVDITQRKQSEHQLRLLTRSLEKQVAERVRLFEILQDIAIAANESRTVKDVMLTALQRITCFRGWIMGHYHLLNQPSQNEMGFADVWYVPDQYIATEDKRVQMEEVQFVASETSVAVGTAQVEKLTATGRPVYLTDFRQLGKAMQSCAAHLNLKAIVAFPIFADQEVVAVIEFFSCEAWQNEMAFLDMMSNVGIQLGHFIERKRLEKAIADAANEQQRHFGRELHDGIAQQLTGLTMMAHTHWENLRETGNPYASTAESLVNHLKKSNDQVRRLSRGLMPIEVDGEGLVQALDELVRFVGQMHGIQCQFNADESAWLPEEGQRIQLFRIAQEAVHNAAKHGVAKTIVVNLRDHEDKIVLTITDDGGGFEPSVRLSKGAGLRIMKYRAELIGGHLTIDSKPGAQTTISCQVPTNPGP